MKYNKIILLAMCIVPMLFSCEKYEDYTLDYDYSAVYFASQKPLRTIVADDEMTFKFGVALGGLRENPKDQWAEYSIAPELLDTVDGADAFTLLPEEYYTLSDEGKIVVPAGEFLGDVTITLDKDLFTSDPLALTNTYALPLLLNETSADSILTSDVQNESKNYTVIVVKYISPYSGFYYSKGVQYELDSEGLPTDTITFSNKDLSQNLVKECTTLSANSVKTSKIGSTISGGLQLTVNEDNSVDVEAISSSIEITESEASFDPEDNIFYTDVKFTRFGVAYNVVDTLIQRQSPELDLRFEEW